MKLFIGLYVVTHTYIPTRTRTVIPALVVASIQSQETANDYER